MTAYMKLFCLSLCATLRVHIVASAFVPPCTLRMNPKSTEQLRGGRYFDTNLYALKPQPMSSLLSSKPKIREKIESFFERENTFEKRQRKREEIEDLEDADFLLADIKPIALVHERDFFRQSARMEAWNEYILVSVLCTSISYGALQSFQLNPDHQGIFLYEVVVKTAIQVLAGLAVLCGLYSTMVFSLSILYGKTALGLERDPQYDEFLEKTQMIRDMAFKSFSLALAFFAMVVVLVLSEDLPLLMHIPVGSVMLGALFIGFRDWKVMVDSATEIYDFLDDEDD